MKWSRRFIVYSIILVAVIIIGFKLWAAISQNEGFTAIAFNTDSYNPSEIFLVAPNASASSSYVDIYATSANDYSKGYTWDEARAACKAFGGDLAPLGLAPSAIAPKCSETGLDLNCAQKLGGNWCAAGWTLDNQTTAYYPVGIPRGCSNSSGALEMGIQTYNPSGSSVVAAARGKAFAICKGPKPVEPTLNVRYFIGSQSLGEVNYSMFDDVSMNKVMMGDTNSDGVLIDVFPKQFTRSQAAYALEKNKYDVASARKYLIEDYGYERTDASKTKVNTLIRDIIDPSYSENPPSRSNTVNTKNESCRTLTSVHTRFKDQLAVLQTLLSDLSGDVIAASGLKEQNMYLQNSIATICQNTATTGTASEACSRLLSIDFDVFYKNTSDNPALQSNLIIDLETLNLALYMRECELQAPLAGLQQVMTLLGCPGYDEVTFKNNRDSKGMPITCQTTTRDPNGAPLNDFKNAFHTGTDIQTNAVEGLKYSLQQISPFYSGANFASLISDVLEQLSVMLRTPLISDYTDSKALFTLITNEVNLINQNIASVK